MNNIVEVKDIRIGDGIPKICVPIVGINDLEIINQVKNIKNRTFSNFFYIWGECYKVVLVNLGIGESNQAFVSASIMPSQSTFG